MLRALASLALLLGAVQAPGPGIPRPQGPAPWNNDLYLSRSTDGVRFTMPEHWQPRAGVPALVRDSRDHLVAAFQWFPEDRPEAWDRVAVRISRDGGATWTDPEPVRIEGMPRGYHRPCDPTLVLLPDGRLRMYFTSHPQDGSSPATYSAVSRDGVSYQWEPGVRFADPGHAVLDCAVARLDGKWHYYAPVQEARGRGYHAVSEDGLRFTRQPDVTATGAGDWLGCVIPVKDGLRFYGSGVWSAFSRDGVKWEVDPVRPAGGGDPGVVGAWSGALLMVTVGPGRGSASPPQGALTVHDGVLMLVSGDTVYEYDAKTLRLLRQGRLSNGERVERPRGR